MGARIAVVDDDPIFLEFMDAVLQVKDYDALLIQKSRGSVTALAAYGPDLIILDLVFGHELRGWKVLAAIRAHPLLATTPVILCTFAQGEAKERIDALRVQNTWYLEKPFDINGMDVLIRTLLAQSEAPSHE